MDRIVIASAAAFESDLLVKRLEDAGLLFTRIITGIGLTQASVTCARSLDLIRGRDVVFVCTGGMIATSFETAIYAARRVCLLPYDIRCGSSELVEAFDPDVGLNSLDFGFARADVAGSLGVSVLNEAGSRYDGFIETMELYGVARAWQHNANSISAFIAVTNAVGADARKNWQSHFQVAAQMTADQLAPKVISHFKAGTNHHEAH
jgi:hypothetical protein